MKIKIFIALILGIIALNEAQAQFDQIFVGAGITGTNIFSDNPSTKPIWSKNYKVALEEGGSFDGAEIGVILKTEFNLDSAGDFCIPIDFEYVWFTAKEIVWPSAKERIYLEHYVDAQKISAGLNWYFYKFPFQNVRPFIGFDLKAMFFNNQVFENRVVNLTTNTTDYRYQQTKDPTFKLGTEFKIGFKGALLENFYLSGSLGIEVMNLLFRDGDRGELLTPFKRYQGIVEDEEKYVPDYHFTLIIEYKL
jgi:hypothetical protein